MLGFAGEFLVGQIIAVGKADLALLAGADADQRLLEFGAGGVFVADEKVTLLEFLADDRYAALIEPLQVGDQHVARLQRTLHCLLGGLATAQLLQLRIDLVVLDFVNHAGGIELLVVFDLDLGPDVERGGEGQVAARLVVELRNLRRCSRDQTGFAGGFFEQCGQQVA